MYMKCVKILLNTSGRIDNLIILKSEYILLCICILIIELE